MKLNGFRFRHVGPFGANGIDICGLEPGLNVIAEPNERGKSSLLTALETVLFLPHTSWKGIAKGLQREDGYPIGEVDFTYEGASYRLTKQFIKSRHAELIDLSNGRTIAIKREAEDRVATMLGLGTHAQGPSGLLWVRQGDSLDAAEDDGQVASRLESELSTLVGGDRARAYLERTEAELGLLLTGTGRVKSGGPLALAESALSKTQSDLEAARTAQQATRTIGLDLKTLRERLTILDSQTDPVAEKKALDEARADLDAAKLAKADADRQHEQLARLHAEADSAEGKLAAHMRAVQNLDEARKGITSAQSHIAELKAQRTDKAAQLDALTEQWRSLDTQRQQLAQLEAHQARFDRLVSLNAALEALTANLDSLDHELNHRAEKVAERDALPALDRSIIQQMDALERTISRTEADLSHVTAKLLMTLEPNIIAHLNDRPVQSGPIQLDANQTLTLVGVGTIRLDATEAHPIRAERDRAKQALTALFDTYSVNSLEDAVQSQQHRQALTDEINLMDRQIDQIAPDGRDAMVDQKTRLDYEISHLRDRINDHPDIPDDLDPAQLERSLSHISGEQSAVHTALQELDMTLATLRERLRSRQHDAAIAPATARPEHRDNVYGKLAANAARLATQVSEAKQILDRTQAKPANNPALIEARIKRLTDVAHNRSKQLSRLQVELATLSAQRREHFEQKDPDAEVARLEARKIRLQEDVQRHRKRAEALILLRDTLQASQRQLQEQYTAPVKQELLPLLRRVIDGADIALTETLGADSLVRNGKDDALDRLSGGTQEQIAILTRIAFARLLAKGGQPCPVILDDALVYADDLRRGRMFDVMHYVTSGKDPLQLLYLSCHEANAAELGGHRVILKPWTQH